MQFFTRKRTIFIIEIILIIAVYLVAKAYSQRHLVTGNTPSFVAATLTGKNVSLDDYRDKPLLLHFWASWCPVCELEQESIEAISKDYDVLTVAMQSGNDLEVSAYMAEHNLTFPTTVDEQGELANQFGVRGVPSSFVISPGGEIVFTEIGYTTEIGLRARMWLAGD